MYQHDDFLSNFERMTIGPKADYSDDRTLVKWFFIHIIVVIMGKRRRFDVDLCGRYGEGIVSVGISSHQPVRVCGTAFIIGGRSRPIEVHLWIIFQP